MAKGVSKPRQYGTKSRRFATSESPRAMIKKPKFFGNKADGNNAFINRKSQENLK